MRKILTTIAAVTAVAVAAPPAVADDPGATAWSHYGQNNLLTGCNTPARVGMQGQYGAWGHYIDGCTVRAWCPNYATRCKVTGEAWIGTSSWIGHRVTLNSRLRRFSSSGAVVGWQDTSCSGTNTCAPNPPLVYTILPGQSASEQCNGVRQSLSNTAAVRCHIFIEYLYN